MEIKEVTQLEEVNKCNEFLNKLIKDEKKYNDNIDDNVQINDYYENFYKSENNKLFIAVDNDAVGYIFIKINDPSKNGELYKEAFIDALYVEEEYRKRGIATSLIEKAKEYSKNMGAKKISINVISKNEEALKLYNKVGFKNFSFRLKQNL